jgi:hypothetical protein
VGVILWLWPTITPPILRADRFLPSAAAALSNPISERPNSWYNHTSTPTAPKVGIGHQLVIWLLRL